eukprot:6946374-Prymnesium_polylepis.1
MRRASLPTSGSGWKKVACLKSIKTAKYLCMPSERKPRACGYDGKEGGSIAAGAPRLSMLMR